MDVSGQAEGKAHFCIGENFRGNDLIGAKCLSRVDKGSKDLSSLLTFTWSRTEQCQPHFTSTQLQLPIAGKVDGANAYCSKTKGADCVSREAYWLLGKEDDSEW